MNYYLHLSFTTARYENARLLVDSGASVNAADRHGRTALMEAAANGKEVVVVMLLSYGADVNAKDSQVGVLTPFLCS